MIKKFINPFEYIAGVNSLGLGIFILLLTSVIGYFSNTHFPDLISVKVNPNYSVLQIMAECLSNWLIVSILFYLAAIIFSKSSIRLIDIFGTQALARSPYLFASLVGFSNSMNTFGRYLVWTYMKQGEPVEITTFQIIIALMLTVFVILLTIWLIILMFNAFKVSANLKGIKLSIIFIVVLIISMIFSVFTNKLFLQGLLT